MALDEIIGVVYDVINVWREGSSLAEVLKKAIKTLEEGVLGFYILTLDYSFIKSEHDNILVSYLAVIRL